MGLIGWLILSFGAFGVVCGSKCIPATAACSRFWVKMEPHKNLMESEDDLNSWCRKQALFYRCLEDVLLDKSRNLSDLPTNLLMSKMFSDDLCLDGSTSRKRYLSNAACINQLNTDYCTFPEYLDIVTPGDSITPSRCSLSEKTFSCIAATLVMNCGFDAGRVYRYLLKVTKHGKEICDVASSEVVQCESNNSSKKDQMSEVYYGLVDRFGSIPEQLANSNSSVLNEMPSSNYVQANESMISEAIGDALDAIDSLEENIEEPENLELQDAETNLRSTDDSRKRPVITKPFKDLLLYNYSGDFEFYWRQPGSFPINRVECKHLLDPKLKGVILECVLQHRFHDPHCVSFRTDDERLTPELIRDIDFTIPEDSVVEISPSIDWVWQIQEYKIIRLRWEYFFNVWLVSRIDELVDLNNHLMTEIPANPFTCATNMRFYDIIKNSEIKWWKCPNLFSDELREEILSILFQNRTRDDYLIVSAFNGNDTTSYIHLFEPVFHGLDQIVCERVNECHPRGRGVIKCSMKRRDVKGCNACCDPYSGRVSPCRSKRPSSREKSVVESSSAETESMVDGSGSADDVSSEESIALLLEGVTSAPEEEQTDFITDVLENGEHVAIDISELPAEFNTEPSSAVSLLFFEQKAENPNEESFVSDVMYASEDATNSQEKETRYGQLSEDEYRLLDENILVLQAVTPNYDAEATYEVDSP